MIHSVKLPTPRIPRVTPTPGADLALADAYRQWFALVAQERACGAGLAQDDARSGGQGDDPHRDPCGALEALQAIRTAAFLCSNPDLVFEVTRQAWVVEHGEEP